MKRKIFVCFLLSFIVLVIIFACYKLLPFSVQVSSSLQALSVCGALIISVAALIYAIKEYVHYKRSTRATLLCHYLERYANEKSIIKVINYIIDSAKVDKTGQIIGYEHNNKNIKNPTVLEKEMFMHFFEELQLQIDEKLLEQSKVIDLLGYYAGIFHRIEGFHKDITDYNNERYWKYYLRFVKNIPDEFFE